MKICHPREMGEEVTFSDDQDANTNYECTHNGKALSKI
jgi:hypothetical protein